MKTGKLLLLAPAILCMGAMPHQSKGVAAVADVDPAAALSSLVSEFAGNYTKKTTIALKSDAVAELDNYFHTKVTETYRTTYYSDSNEALLMAPQDGTLGGQQWGGFRVVDGKCQRFHVDAGTEVAVAALTGGTVDYNYGSGSKLYDFYKNMEYFAQSNYFSGWGEYTAGSSYYYNFSAAEQAAKEGGAYTNKFIADFLAFAAPQLLPNFGAYFTPKSVTVVKDYDAKGVEYLAFRMYVVEGDKGKLDTDKNQYFGADGLCEARIYKDLSKFSEELGLAYYLAGKIGGVDHWGCESSLRMVKDPENVGQYKLSSEKSFKKGDKIKVRSSKNEWFNFGNYNYGYETDTNYTIYYDGNYNVFLNSEKVAYVGVASAKVYLKDTINYQKDGAKIAIWIYDTSTWADPVVDSEHSGFLSFTLSGNEVGSKFSVVRFEGGYNHNWDHKWNEITNVQVKSSGVKDVFNIDGWSSGTWQDLAD